MFTSNYFAIDKYFASFHIDSYPSKSVHIRACGGQFLWTAWEVRIGCGNIS